MNNLVVYLMFWLSILLEPQVLQDVEVVLGVTYSLNFEDTGCSTKQVVCSNVTIRTYMTHFYLFHDVY